MTEKRNKSFRLILKLVTLSVIVGFAVFLSVNYRAINEYVCETFHLDHQHSEAEHSHNCEDHDHNAEDDHDHEAEEKHDSSEIVFSAVAAKNIGLDETTIATVRVTDYYKSLTIPAVVVERPGKTNITVPSPVSGVISKIYFEKGVSVKPGEPLFEILLNQQEMIKGQTEYLSLVRKQAVNASELERLSQLDTQVVPKQKRELEFQKSEIELERKLLRNTLLLQGLTETDINESLETAGEIVQNMTIYAPPMIGQHSDEPAEAQSDHTYSVEELYVTTGKNVTIGDPLCLMSDLCELAIRGKFFVVNSKEITNALNNRSRVTAVFEGTGTNRELIEPLHLRSIDNYIDNETGSLFCYVDLQNKSNTYRVDDGSPSGNRRNYTNWHFKPGQRCELNIEYETLPNCIVLPVDAVAYQLYDPAVFQWVGNEGDRRIWRKTPVHVIHTTKDVVVIANDGSIFPDAKVATKGAGFILAALEAANQKSVGGSGGIQHGDHVH